MYCIFCGNKLELEYENNGLEQYHCYDCDILYTKTDEEISYIRNATNILNQIENDLQLMKKNNLINF